MRDLQSSHSSQLDQTKRSMDLASQQIVNNMLKTDEGIEQRLRSMEVF